jgi:3D (Asp-Asp-Asp) domain-containing protein
MEQTQTLDLVKTNRDKVKPISRGVTESVERRVMTVSAYTKSDFGMNGKGLTASGTHVLQGRTVAADRSIPFDTRISIPALGMTLTVEDRGAAIKGNRLDLYMDKREDALAFGVKKLEVFIRREK